MVGEFIAGVLALVYRGKVRFFVLQGRLLCFCIASAARMRLNFFVTGPTMFTFCSVHKKKSVS